MKYRLYIDEVGNADLKSSENPNHRFLSLTGVIIDLDYVRRVLHPEMESLKEKYFDSHPDDKLILHRKEMMNGRFPFEALKDVGVRRKFDAELLALLTRWKYTVITVCIDKKAHREKYTVWTYEPYHYCLKVMMERYIHFLELNNVVGDAMSESRGGKEDMKLKGSFERLWESGTDYIAADRFQKVFTSKQLKVRQKKENITGLQLADLVAHPSRSEILDSESLFNRKLPPFADMVIKILQTKYLQRNGIIKGWGKKFI